jgi:hypothetical protein
MSAFNIIPGSTLFLDGAWANIDCDDLAPKLKKLMKKLSFEKMQVVCVNKASVQMFWKYLQG